MLFDPLLLVVAPPKPSPRSVMARRPEPLVPLASKRPFVEDAPGIPGGDVSPDVIPLSGLPVPPLLPEDGPPMTVPRLIPSPIEFEFCKSHGESFVGDNSNFKG